MREALKNLFAKQITLPNGEIFLYTVNPYEIKNAIDQTVAFVDEYTFTSKNSNSSTYKLYRTKEDSWYQVEQSKIVEENSILRMLKAAIDTAELNAATN